VKFYFWYSDVYGLTNFFRFDAEMNIPTLFSSLALALSASLLLVISVAHKKLGSSHLLWAGLAVIFMFLTIDETSSFHERLSEPIRQSLNTSGLLYFAWVIPYGIALTVFCLLYFRFLLNLPRKTMTLFVASSAIYVSGALGLEMISALHAEIYGIENLAYQLITTVEESLEMTGIVIFIYALLAYITDELTGLTMMVEKPAQFFGISFQKRLQQKDD
jgi:hypothetical protein